MPIKYMTNAAPNANVHTMPKLFFGLRKSARPELTGGALVADFTAAMTNLATAETAKYAATKSEEDTIATINAAAPTNAVYVTPEDMSPAMQAAVARSSVDAHLKKVQAEQINSFTAQQVAQTEQDDKQNYIGRKVRVTVIDPEFKPLESYWFNNKTGQEGRGNLKFKTAKGRIEDLSLQNNVLVLKPTWGARLVIPERKFLLVYVVNPKSLQPAVRIDLV